MLHTLGLGVVLSCLWLLLSGLFDNLLILSLGLASVLFVLHIASRMDVIDHEGHPVHLGRRVVTYWPWLLWEIIKANIDVAKIIISPKMEIQPHFFEVDARVENQLILGKDPDYAISTGTTDFGSSHSIILTGHLSRVEKLNLIPLREGKYPTKPHILIFHIFILNHIFNFIITVIFSLKINSRLNFSDYT